MASMIRQAGRRGLGALVLGLVLNLMLVASALAGTARIDAGGKGGLYGAVYEADRVYSTDNGSGAIGGTPATPWLVYNGQVIENSPYGGLVNSVREGVQEYRFDVPNGNYLLTLQFIELFVNGPNLRRFSVVAEGKALLSDLDLYARFGRNYAVTYQFAVTVADGQLNVTFPASVGQSTIAAISVQNLTPPNRVPRRPTGLEVRGGFYRNIIAWADSNEPLLAGWEVSRSSSPAGPFTVITPSPVPASRWFDDNVTPFVAQYYRVAAVDVMGNRGPTTAALAAAPVDRTQAALPVYRISITPANYAILQANPQSDYVPADFIAGNTTYAGIGVKFRGTTSLNNHKKSWKVNFKKGAPFEGRDKLNLKALGLDNSLLTECLSAAQQLQGTTLTPGCDAVYLEVNGEYMGVFSRIEEVDDDFFSLRGITPKGQLLEAQTTPYANLMPLDDWSTGWDDHSANHDGYPALAALVQLLNDTPDSGIAAAVAGAVNVDATLDYLAALQVNGDWDHVPHNYYLYKAPDTLLWELVPKDFDQAFNLVNLSLLQGVKTQPRQGAPTINMLTSRLLNVPLYRQWYVNKLRELRARSFTPELLAARITSLHTALAAEAQRDVNKRFREDNVTFDGSPTTLQSFVTDRIAYLDANLPALDPGIAQPLLINELVVDNRSGIVTAEGLHSPWVELYNPGSQPYSLAGHGLSNDASQPLAWTFPAGTTVPASGYLLVWLDGRSVPGELHTSFTVSPRGQSLTLSSPSGAMLDMIGWRAQPPDTAWGRRLSGAASWARQARPTPLAANTGPP